MAMQQRPSKSAGYILFITLIFLQLFSLLTVQGTSGNISHRKQMRRQLQKNAMHQSALRVLAELDAQRLPPCIKQSLPASSLSRQPLSWWKQNACHGRSDQHEYYYRQESLGEDRCAVVTGSALSAAYYRHTIIILAGENIYDAVMLQDTIVAASNLTPQCDHEPAALKPGRQTLRILR